MKRKVLIRPRTVPSKALAAPDGLESPLSIKRPGERKICMAARELTETFDVLHQVEALELLPGQIAESVDAHSEARVASARFAVPQILAKDLFAEADFAGT